LSAAWRIALIVFALLSDNVGLALPFMSVARHGSASRATTNPMAVENLIFDSPSRVLMGVASGLLVKPPME
jgi:hypothetical protein